MVEPMLDTEKRVEVAIPWVVEEIRKATGNCVVEARSRERKA